MSDPVPGGRSGAAAARVRPLAQAARDRTRRRLRRGLPRLAGCRERLPAPAAGVALTFDDGPDPVFTPQVLDLLAAHRAVATFFLVGERARQHPELVRRIVREGHAVGSHTQHHRDPAVAGLLETVLEVWRGHRSVRRAARVRTRLFRPPFGHVGTATAVAVRLAGVRSWLWSVDPRDWRPDVRVEEVLAALREVRAGDVVLLHDGIATAPAPEAEDRTATVQALRLLLEEAAARGLVLARLPVTGRATRSPRG